MKVKGLPECKQGRELGAARRKLDVSVLGDNSKRESVEKILYVNCMYYHHVVYAPGPQEPTRSLRSN